MASTQPLEEIPDDFCEQRLQLQVWWSKVRAAGDLQSVKSGLCYCVAVTARLRFKHYSVIKPWKFCREQVALQFIVKPLGGSSCVFDGFMWDFLVLFQ